MPLQYFLEGLKKLEYRGYDSAGIAVTNEGEISLVKTSGKIVNLCEKIDNGAALPGCSGIGHARWATHGVPNDINAHPHLSNDSKFAIVHNGIIENYIVLREELLEKGYTFESETDTEVIVHLIEMYYRGNLKEAVMKTAARLRGVICSGGNLFRVSRYALRFKAGQSPYDRRGSWGELFCLS